MKHKHHIVPRHMGGDDNPYNITELSIEDHAEAHRILYDKYGKEEDKIAWQMLSGRIQPEEARIKAAAEGSKRWVKENKTTHRNGAIKGGYAYASKRREEGTLHSSMEEGRKDWNGTSKWLSHQKAAAKKAGEKLSKSIKTPDGIFKNSREAAAAYNIPIKTAQKRVQRGSFGWSLVGGEIDG